MHGVAARAAEPADGRLADTSAAGRRRRAVAKQPDHGAEAFDRAGTQVHRCRFADELAALGIVGIGQQRRGRHFDEIGIAVERLAIGKGELGALDLQMNEVGARRIEIDQDRSL